MQRWLAVLLFSWFVTGCELVGDVFQAGLVVGILVVLALIALIAWVMRRFRG